MEHYKQIQEGLLDRAPDLLAASETLSHRGRFHSPINTKGGNKKASLYSEGSPNRNMLITLGTVRQDSPRIYLSIICRAHRSNELTNSKFKVDLNAVPY